MGLHAAIVVCLPWFFGFVPGTQDPAVANDVLRTVMVAPVEQNVAEGLVVEVVDEAGKPAGGAIVGYFAEDLNQPDEARRRVMDALFAPGKLLDEDRRTATLLLAFGTRYRADAKGRAILPSDARRPVMACWNGMAAMESGAATATATPVRIVLRRPVSVRVRVVDPAGVPVSGIALGMFRDERDNHGATWLTDRRGEAVMVVTRHLREARQPVRIATRLGLQQEPCIRVACDAIPAEPLVLQVPETGLVRVIVYGDDEKPREDVVSVSLRPDGERPFVFVTGKAEPSGALVRVPLGVTYAVSASLRGASGELQGKCKGPMKANELIVCDLRATQGPPMVSFVVRGLDGEPVRDEDLGYVLFAENWSSGSTVRSDGDGRVRAVLPQPRPNGLEVLVLRRGRSAGPQSVSVYEGARRFVLPAGLPAGEAPLPELRLVEEPVLVAGQVVDDDGKPIAGAIVSGPPGWKRASSGWSGGGSGRQFFDHRLITGADGRFELRDAVTPTTVQVSAFLPQPGRAPANAQCEAGAKTVQLVLRRTGKVRIVLDGLPKTQHELLEGSVVPAGGGAETRRFSVRDAPTTMDLAAGRYDIVLRLDDQAADVLRITDVEVPPGGECNDPRLLQIPWREHLKLVTLTVVDRDQRPVKTRRFTHWVKHEKNDGYGGGGGQTDDEGRCTLLVPKAGGHVVFVSGGGLRGAGLEAVTTDRTVTLAPEIGVRIELRGDRTVPEGIEQQFQLQQTGAPQLGHLQSLLHGVENPVLRAGKPGIFAAALGQPGTLQMQMIVSELIGPRRNRLHSFTWGSIDVKDQLEPQSFVLDMPAAERERFEALVERLKQ